MNYVNHIKEMYIIVLIILFTFLVNTILSHMHTAYSHDKFTLNFNYYKSWMREIDNKTLLRDLSLPGTHDTMALYGSDIAKCQSMSLQTQLNAGIRVLDIRCRHYKNRFPIHHGVVYQKTNFYYVLKTMSQFLIENPSETLLMRVKEEYKAAQNTRSFEDSFISYYEKFNDSVWTPSTQNPTLDEVRGKIVILQNFVASKLYGLEYSRKSLFNIQDDYKLSSNWALYSKWEKVKKHLNYANDNIGKYFYMNYLTGSVGSFPYFVASGHVSSGTSAARLSTGRTTPAWNHCCLEFPRDKCVLGVCSIYFEGTNVLTYNYLVSNKPKFIGILMTDFPGEGLIRAIIERNF